MHASKCTDYGYSQEEVKDQRLERIWFGSGADTKLKALTEATTLAAK